MAGKMCPSCGNYTFFLSPEGRTCTRCGFRMVLPVNSGRGGKGQKCPNCGKQTVFNKKCRNCGAQFYDDKLRG